MEKSLSDERDSYPRHFTDVFGCFGDDQDKLRCSSEVNKLRRRPKCKTRNKYTDESFVQMCDDSCYRATLFELPKSTVTTERRTDICRTSSDLDERELVDVQTAQFTTANVQRPESLPLFDIVCSSLLCSESISSHQAAALSRCLSRRRAIQTASSSLTQILMTSKCPLVSLICCRLLKKLRLMPCKFLLAAESTHDVVSYVLFLQKEMVKFLETGKFSISLLNVICFLDCITATCHDVPAHYNEPRVDNRFCLRWSSSELRWAVLTVISLANVISAKVRLTSAVGQAADAISDDDARSVRVQVERIPQILTVMLTTSVQCEVAQASNIFRILNDYWHTTDFCQRRLIVESVSVPKLRMDLCIMILAKHCDVLGRQYSALSLSLRDILHIFVENVVVSAITQRVWMNDESLSVVGHCQEICLILCGAVCSYILHQKGQSAAYVEKNKGKYFTD